MTVSTDGPRAQITPWAKERILQTASALFYDDGIRTVGVDRLIGEAGVTKATFYKHYGSKDRLILSYLNGQHTTDRAELEEIADRSADPRVALGGVIAVATERIAKPGFRGCAYLNAAAEFPDSNHPVRDVVTQHREWYSGFLADLLRDLGHRMPGDGADDLLLALDGARSGGYAGDAIAACASLRRVADRVIEAARPAA